jgi:WD40 repeat protein
MRYIVILAFLLTAMVATEIKAPIAKFYAGGGVVDLVYADSKLYSATNIGTVDIFDINSSKMLKQIKLNKTTDFMGDEIDSKVYSVDVLSDKILLLSQAQKGARRVHIFQNEKLELIIPYTQRLFIAKAKFLDDDTIIMALLSNEKKDELIVADESGDLTILNTKNGSVVKKLTGQNLDNVFQVDTKNKIIATAGQDRRVVVYIPKLDLAYYKSSTFLIYSVGLSPSGKTVAYASDENNNVTAFDSISKKVLGKFGGNKMTLTNILFLNENEFLVAGDDKTINKYKIR